MPRTFWQPLAAVIVVLFGLSASAAEPSFSEHVRTLIDTKGVQVARQQASMMLATSMNQIEPDPQGMLALADEYLEKNDVDAAELVLQLEMMFGNSADVIAKLGDVYVVKGVPFVAAAFYQQALQIDPEHERAKSQAAKIAEDHPEVRGMLSAKPSKTPPVPAPPATTPASPDAIKEPAPEASSPNRDYRNSDDLLPYVVITDPGRIDGLDFGALRKQARTDYPSRWDDLTLVDSCLWISPEELQAHLGMSLRLTAKRRDFQCKYQVHFPEGDSDVLLSVYVERHPNPEKLRESQRRFYEGVSGMQFTAFDPGAKDLTVYLSKKGRYLYVFPHDGITMWRLGYKVSVLNKDRFPLANGDGPIEQDIGARFMKLLVEKYGGRL